MKINWSPGVVELRQLAGHGTARPIDPGGFPLRRLEDIEVFEALSTWECVFCFVVVVFLRSSWEIRWVPKWF